MLDVGRNQDPCGHPVTVQPSNFLRAFRTLPEASAMGLLMAENHPEIKVKSTLPRLAQVTFNNMLISLCDNHSTLTFNIIELGSFYPSTTQQRNLTSKQNNKRTDHNNK
jgi:hypothetical protein